MGRIAAWQGGGLVLDGDLSRQLMVSPELQELQAKVQPGSSNPHAVEFVPAANEQGVPLPPPPSFPAVVVVVLRTAPSQGVLPCGTWPCPARLGPSQHSTVHALQDLSPHTM